MKQNAQNLKSAPAKDIQNSNLALQRQNTKMDATEKNLNGERGAEAVVFGNNKFDINHRKSFGRQPFFRLKPIPNHSLRAKKASTRLFHVNYSKSMRKLELPSTLSITALPNSKIQISKIYFAFRLALEHVLWRVAAAKDLDGTKMDKNSQK